MAGYGVNYCAGGLFLLMLVYLQPSQGAEVRVRRGDDDEIKVTILPVPPYVTVKSGKTGNARFEGFIPELLAKVAAREKLKYKMHLVKDGLYGTAQSGGEWTGMIGEVLRKEADLATAPVTEQRKKVVEFSEPFMNITTTVLIQRPPAGQEPPFSTVRDLADQSAIHYGLIKNSRDMAFFQNSQDPTYRKMWQYMMNTQPEVNPFTYEEGVNRVRFSNGQYAFIIKSSYADYWIGEYPCEFMRVGDLDNRYDYGFVTSDQPELLGKVNRALKALKASGELKDLKDKWWKSGNTCSGGATVMANSLFYLTGFCFHLFWSVLCKFSCMDF